MSEKLLVEQSASNDLLQRAVFPEQRVDSRTPQETLESYFPYRYGNSEMPISKKRDLILDTIASNPITIIRTPTGAGKSTQIGQMLYEDGYDVTITQPRIVAARTLTDRVREEMIAVDGPEAAALVGYRTAYESDYSPENKIVFCTDGLELMKEFSGEKRPENNVLVIDEAHEQNANMTLLMSMAKREVAINPQFRVVIMSATIDTDQMANYFCDVSGIPAPIVDVEGRTYPVTDIDGGDFVDAAEQYSNEKKNILVFVPGKPDIEKAIRLLRPRLGSEKTILPLHGEQTAATQMETFDSYEGGKIIIATNVAQTSLTFPDIDVVLDCGYGRSKDIKDDVEGLYVEPVSVATQEQRRGRVGRTKPGIYHRVDMPGMPQFPTEEQRELYDKPEIARQRLDSIVLRLANANIGVGGLDYYFEPDKDSVESAIGRLRKIGALALDGTITEIGTEMAYMPLEPNYARMIVTSRMYGMDVRIQTIAAIVVQQDDGITVSSADSKVRWKKLTKEKSSDVLSNLDIFVEALRMDEEERQRHAIVEKKFLKAKEAFEELCKREELDYSLISSPTDSQRADIRSCIISGADELYLHLGGNAYRDIRGKKRHIGKKSSIGGNRELLIGAPFNLSHASETGQFERRFIRGATIVGAKALAEFAPERCDYEEIGFTLENDGTVRVKKAVTFDGIDTGTHVVEPAQPSARVRDFIIQNLVDGPYQNANLTNTVALRQNLQKLHDLQQRTKEPLHIPIAAALIKENLRDYIPETVATVEEINAYIPEYPASLFISPEQQQQIIESSPNHIMVGDKRVRVRYKDGDAYILLNAGDAIPQEIPELSEHDIYIGFKNTKTYHKIDDAKVVALRPPRAIRRAKQKKGIDRSIGSMATSRHSNIAPDIARNEIHVQHRGINQRMALSRRYAQR